MPGPKPLPRAVKRRRGTFRPSRESCNNSDDLPPLGPVPRDLSEPERVVWRWARSHGWWLRDADALVVRQLCEVDTDYHLARQAVQAEPTSYKNPTQAVWLMLKLRQERLRMYAVLGLDPSSRGKLEMPEREGDDPVRDFLFRRPELRINKIERYSSYENSDI